MKKNLKPLALAAVVSCALTGCSLISNRAGDVADLTQKSMNKSMEVSSLPEVADVNDSMGDQGGLGSKLVKFDVEMKPGADPKNVETVLDSLNSFCAKDIGEKHGCQIRITSPAPSAEAARPELKVDAKISRHENGVYRYCLDAAPDFGEVKTIKVEVSGPMRCVATFAYENKDDIQLEKLETYASRLPQRVNDPSKGEEVSLNPVVEVKDSNLVLVVQHLEKATNY